MVPPSTDPSRNRFCWISDTLTGDVLHRLWWSDVGDVLREYGQGSYPSHPICGFRFHWRVSANWNGIRGWLRMISFYLGNGLRLHRQNPFDCIVVYSHMTTGLCGVILKLLTGAKLVIEIATSPADLARSHNPQPRLRDWLHFLYSELALHASVLAADRVHVLAPQILKPYRLLRHCRQSVFHEFTVHPETAAQDASDSDDSPFVLLVGAPWYLKGADLLVTAFQALAEDFPSLRLRLLGHYPDRDPLDRLIAGHPRIEVLAPRPNPEALRLIARAAVLVLPSRCEGMGRVLVEAMAAGVPVIGADVGGIPHMIQDGVNGFLFPKGDAKALEQRLRTMLSNPERARQMGARGREMAREEYSEARWAEHFTTMVEATVKGLP